MTDPNLIPSSMAREPVDWKALNILDYPEKVKNPMDLGTVMKKLDNSEYSSVEEGALGMVESVFYVLLPRAFLLELFKLKF